MEVYATPELLKNRDRGAEFRHRIGVGRLANGFLLQHPEELRRGGSLADSREDLFDGSIVRVGIAVRYCVNYQNHMVSVVVSAASGGLDTDAG